MRPDADTKRTHQIDKRRSRPNQPIGIEQAHLQAKSALRRTLVDAGYPLRSL
jgi:hypothetical protein